MDSLTDKLSLLLSGQKTLAEIGIGNDDLIAVSVLGSLALAFVVLAALFVVRSRRKRIRELTEAFAERDLTSPEFADDRAVDDGEKPQLVAGAEQDDEPAISAENDDLDDASAAASETPAKAPSQEDAAALQARLNAGLSKTRKGFIGRLGAIFGKRELDADLLEELEAILLSSDVGVHTADHLLELVRKQIDKKEIDAPDKVRATLKTEILRILEPCEKPLQPSGASPYVIMVIGVNGGGKTTTIGKMAQHYSALGHKVVLGAGDTFRAAAADQLEIWAERAGVQIVRGKEGQDPSSVLFDAVKQAKGSGADLVIADTAGRLHTKVNLMEELKKVQRVMAKAVDGAPHEVLLVLDSTTGQNAIAQAKQFNEAIPVTGLVLTKLDGTAKGGVIVGVSQAFGFPIRFIGIGEKAEDLRPFAAAPFVDALFSEESGV